MDDHERDRRDVPEASDDDRTDAAGGSSEIDDRQPLEPGDEATASPAEIESWPSQDAPAETSRAWPTEPPEAGSGTGWPTEPPERGDEPILEPAGERVETEPDLTGASVPEEPTSDEWDRAMAAEPAVVAGAATAAEPPPAGTVDAGIEPETRAVEPPPSEVEAYPAAAPTEDQAAAAAAVAAAHAVPAAESEVGESTQCPRCGTENRPGLSFCRNCGQRLVAAGIATTVERPGTPEGTMACPRCGTHNRTGVAFCQNCGANLRGTAPGYVPPVAAGPEMAVEPARAGAVLGPVVLLIGLVGLATGYLLPFAYGGDSLFDRAFGPGGYGIAFWNGYPGDGSSLADQAYFGLAAAIPILGLLLVALAIAGFIRAAPGPVQMAGLVVALVWSIGLIVLFGVVEVAGSWDGEIVGLLRELTPAGIIFFLSSLIVVIGTLTRFGRG